jgi:hypothetical protein
MKTLLVNGKAEEVTETRAESVSMLATCFIDEGLNPLTDMELKHWGIQAEMSTQDLQKMTREYIQELASNKQPK